MTRNTAAALVIDLKFTVILEQLEKKPACAAAWNQTSVLHIFWVRCSHVKQITLKVKKPVYVFLYKHVLIRGFYNFSERWHFRRPKVKFRLGHKLFCLMAYICLNSRGEGQSHKNLKDRPAGCRLGCHHCCPGDHEMLPVEISWWIKIVMTHHWHTQRPHGDHYCQGSVSEEVTMANWKLEQFHCQQRKGARH